MAVLIQEMVLSPGLKNDYTNTTGLAGPSRGMTFKPTILLRKLHIFHTQFPMAVAGNNGQHRRNQ